MKRLFFCAGIALWLLSSCGNDKDTPDTSGQTHHGADTVNGLPGGSPNMNNDNTNNTNVNTADSSMKKIISQDSTQRPK